MHIPGTRPEVADFVGREWLFDRVAAWLAGPAGEPVYAIVGCPGLGKTTVAARLAELPAGDRFVHAHFCRVGLDQSLDATEFVHELASALGTRSPEFRQALLDDDRPVQTHLLGEVDLRGGSVALGGVAAGIVVRLEAGEAPRVALQRLVNRPLTTARRRGWTREVLLIVDALDEAYSHSAHDGVHALIPRLVTLPGVRVIATTRPDPRVLRLLPAPAVELRKDHPQEMVRPCLAAGRTRIRSAHPAAAGCVYLLAAATFFREPRFCFVGAGSVSCARSYRSTISVDSLPRSEIS
ncbi:hypothetical protein CF165_47215 [Amycolatopsis vastitatis]|uniref:AAA+ ATPase domain-containing protein n=1 Tax=Amycolatopsis vastitatis TaxID=1905142 RepID=A0A229SLB1_9PSEU|nr:hypothetical protein CF165_47215 [Amycolatopsis vastitatis]